MKTFVTLGFTIIALFVTPHVFGQTVSSEQHSNNLETSPNESPALSAAQPTLQRWHNSFHTTKARSIHAEHLTTGNTYTRYGELASPTGFGVQVVAFRNIKNLRKYLHMYEQKELYIQVVSLADFGNEKIYRVILGADENQHLIEKEISLFNNAGVNAVLRKHKEAADKETSASAMR